MSVKTGEVDDDVHLHLLWCQHVADLLALRGQHRCRQAVTVSPILSLETLIADDLSIGHCGPMKHYSKGRGVIRMNVPHLDRRITVVVTP